MVSYEERLAEAEEVVRKILKNFGQEIIDDKIVRSVAKKFLKAATPKLNT
jgi:hypothetical protein